jgi:hypothetical protein
MAADVAAPATDTSRQQEIERRDAGAVHMTMVRALTQRSSPGATALNRNLQVLTACRDVDVVGIFRFQS